MEAVRMIARAKTCRDATDQGPGTTQRQHPRPPCLTSAAHEAYRVGNHSSRAQLTCSSSRVAIADYFSSITMAPRPSITGFDPKKFAAASANGTKGDPWAR
jgi:hypothetical protein